MIATIIGNFTLGALVYLLIFFAKVVFDFMRCAFAEIEKDKDAKFLDENPLVYIEKVKQKDKVIYLVFDAFTKRFICQGVGAVVVATELRRVFANKKNLAFLVNPESPKNSEIKIYPIKDIICDFC